MKWRQHCRIHTSRTYAAYHPTFHAQGHAERHTSCAWKSPNRLDPHPKTDSERNLQYDTLSPRGVCSRMPHLRRICRATHGQLSTHVFLLHIIPFMGCLRLSVVVVSIDSHSENPCFPIQLVDTHSFVPTALTPHPAKTGVFSKWCWCMSSQKRICTCSARAILSVAKFRQDIFDNVAITHQLKAVFRI